MFLSGIEATVRGHTAREAEKKFAPDGKVLTEIRLGVGGGSEKYPVMWVSVTVWESVAEEATVVIDRKGMRVEAVGMLTVNKYMSKHGIEVDMSLRNVRELRVYDRDGELEKELPFGKVE